MAHKWRISSYILMCHSLLALPSGRDALTCCRRDFRNGSTSCQLSDAPDPTCDAHWSADRITVVDETGETDPTRVQYAGPQTLVLKEKHTDVILHMDCKPPKKSLKLSCNAISCLAGKVLAAEPEDVDLTTHPLVSRRMAREVFTPLKLFGKLHLNQTLNSFPSTREPDESGAFSEENAHNWHRQLPRELPCSCSSPRQ